jgi:flagellar biosynthetic protein FliP
MRAPSFSIARELVLVVLVMLVLALMGASHARAEPRHAGAAAAWNAADEMTRPSTHGKTAAPAWTRASVPEATAQPIRIVLGLTTLAILPALLICTTSFLRIVIVLSMLRHALGMQDTPPNSALLGLALFLTLFTMSPVLQDVDRNAFQPFMQGSLSMEDAYKKGVAPMRAYMIRQTREQDVALMIELSKAPPPTSIDEVGNVQLVPAYMLSELRAAFQIGFVIFLPFVLIDLVVACILMALGMMMMPPTTISLPLKILMFVLIDGWSLLLKALVGSFH